MVILVTTCVVVWIEIWMWRSSGEVRTVTTCVVVWIEILTYNRIVGRGFVTTCVVVWIEITIKITGSFEGWSPPAWWCGLKFPWADPKVHGFRSPPAWWCGLKYTTL